MASSKLVFDKEDVEIGLQLLKRYHLKELVNRKGLTNKVDNMNKTDQLQDALLSEEWDLSDYRELLDMIEVYKKESDPLGYYITSIKGFDYENGLDLEELKRRLDEDIAQFDQNRENLLRSGFEIVDFSDNVLSGIYWTQSINYHLNPLRELKQNERLYETTFEIDVNNETIYIGASLQSKAKQLIKKLEENGLSTEKVGHGTLMSEDANEHVENFVDELKEKTRKNQTRVNAYNGERERKRPPSLRIYSVGILTKDEKLKRVNADGDADIFEDNDIRTFIDERGGKIIRLEGKFEFREEPFGFNASYDAKSHIGRLSVQKEQSPTGEPDIVDDCFDFLVDLYREHYISYQ